MNSAFPPRNLVLSEIRAIESRIRNLGSDSGVRQAWGLSGAKLVPVLGADIESYCLNRAYFAKVIFESGYGAGLQARTLIDSVWQRARRDLWNRPEIDLEALEVRLSPGNATSVAGSYNKLARLLPIVGKQHGFDCAIGAGHWHFSLFDEGQKRHLLNNNVPSREAYSDFSRTLADNLLALHLLCPALFLRASRSEKVTADVTFTKRLSISHSYARTCVIQMNGDSYPNGARMFEMRMANLAPLVPVLMLLHAVERTLTCDNVLLNDYNEAAVSLRRGDCFIRGKGAHFDDLRTTQESGYLERHFPRSFPLLMDMCLDSYERFLQTPSWSVMYTPTERNAALQKLGLYRENTKLPALAPLADRPTHPLQATSFPGHPRI